MSESGLPPYVALPQAPYMSRPNYLGAQHRAFVVGNPAADGFKPPLAYVIGCSRRRRLPPLDQALSTLIEDIFARGMDRRIMVVAVGEFGRTPRLSHNSSGTGRDHWPQAYSALISGGGLRMGQVVGATNGKGEYPTERPYSPQDLLATIYRHLGIDWRHSFVDPAGRPVAILSDGAPIRELL